MIKRLTILFTVLYAMCISAHGRVVQTIVLDNGNRFEGYISKTFNDGSVEIYSENTEFTIPAQSIIQVDGRGKNCTISAVPGVLPAIAEPFIEYADTTDVVYIPRCEILSRNNGVRVRVAQYPCEFSTTIDRISEIKYEIPDAHPGSGVEDIVYTKKGEEFSGRIISKIPGVELTLKTGNDTKKISYSDIKAISRRHIDKNTSVFVQVPLLETVTMSFGDKLADVMTADTDYEDSTFKIVDQNLNLSRSYDLNDIVMISYSENPEYDPYHKPVVENASSGKTSNAKAAQSSNSAKSRTISVNGRQCNLGHYKRDKAAGTYTVSTGGYLVGVGSPGQVKIDVPADISGDFIVFPVNRNAGMSKIVIPAKDVFSKAVAPSRRLAGNSSSGVAQEYRLSAGIYAVFFLQTGEYALILVK